MADNMHWAFIVNGAIERASDASISVSNLSLGYHLVTFPSNVGGCTATLNNSMGMISAVPGDLAGYSANQATVSTFQEDGTAIALDFTVVCYSMT